MSTNSSIEWTDATWNPVVGCTRVSAGCDNCYAVRQSYRNGEMGHAKYRGLTVLNPKGERHFNGVVRTVESALSIPLRRKKPTVYFVNSMSDLFHKDVPFDFIDRVFAVMALTPQHTYQVLTKRPERMAEYLNEDGRSFTIENVGWSMLNRPVDLVAAGGWPLPNVWLGTSVEDAERKERIDHLRSVPATVRFLSLEPLLGDLGALDLSGIHWVIVGGESGPGARECDLWWMRSIKLQCEAAGVPLFVKQLGALPRLPAGVGWAGTPGGGSTAYTIYDELKLRDKKGGNPDEWPKDLRVRKFPAPASLPSAGAPQGGGVRP